MKKYLIGFAFSLLWACGQDEDQLLKGSPAYQELFDISHELIAHNPDSVLSFAQQSLRRSERNDDNEGVAVYSLIIGEICFIRGEFNLANTYLFEALTILENVEPLDKQAQRRLGRSYNLLGRVYQYSGQPDLAISYYEKALVQFKASENLKGQAESFGYIGHFHEKEANYDSALFYQQQALELYRTSGDSSGLATIYDNIGSIHEDLENYEVARDNFEKAYRIHQVQGNEVEALVHLNNLGDVHRKTNRLREALKIYGQVLQRAKSLNQVYQMRSAYRDLSKIYTAMGDSNEALLYLDSAYEINSQIYNEEIARDIANTRTIYEVEQKEQQLALLAKDRAIERIYLIALVVGIILIGIIGGLVYLQQRSVLRKDRAIYEAEKAVTSANEERLKLELESKQLKQERLQQEVMVKSKELTTNALHIIQKNEFLQDLRDQLKDLAKTESEPLNKRIKKIRKSIEYNFSLDDDWQEFESIFQQVHEDFFEQLREQYPDLTSAEIRLCAMIRLNLFSKDMSTIMGISQDSLRIARYRLRKKLGIDKGENLTSFIMNIG